MKTLRPRRRPSNAVRYTKSGKIPLTLIEADTAANRKAGLMTMAAAMRDLSHCHAGIISAYARQIGDSYTSAQAIANYLEVPSGEVTLSDPTQAEVTQTETIFAEPPIDPYS